MTELFILKELFSSARDGTVIDLRALHESFDGSVLAPYVGDVESSKQLIFRLNQESVMYASVRGDEVHVEHVEGESPVHGHISLLVDIIKASKDVSSFKRNVSVSPINRFFMDEKEMELVYLVATSGGFTIQGAVIERALSELQAGSDDQQAKLPPVPDNERKVDAAPVDDSKVKIARGATVSSSVGDSSTRNVTEMRKMFDLKIEKLRSVAKDYVEKLLADENEIELKVLRHLLNELLPLKEIHLDPGVLIKDAIIEKQLPWALDGDIYKRSGALVDVHHHEKGVLMSRAVKKIASILRDCLKENACVSFDEVKQALERNAFTFPDGENIESLIERSIREGMFSGYIDLVTQHVYRPKSDDERYQQSFQKELNALAREIKHDANKMLDLERVKSEIPRDLEAVLIAPEKPKELTGILDTTQTISEQFKAFLLDALVIGSPVPVAPLVKQIKALGVARNITLPFTIDRAGIEKMLEDMVRQGVIDGYFQDDDTFVRRK